MKTTCKILIAILVIVLGLFFYHSFQKSVDSTGSSPQITELPKILLSPTMSATAFPESTNSTKPTSTAIPQKKAFTTFKMCPTKRTISVEQMLSDHPTINLVMRDSIDNKLVRKNSRPGITAIPGIQPSINLSSGIKFSPDQTKFAYKSLVSKKMNESAKFDIWVSLIDGSDQSKVMANVDGGLSFDWMDQNRLILWHPERSLSCPSSVNVINIQSQNTVTISIFQNGQERINCYAIPLLDKDLQTSIVRGEKDWLLIDNVTKTMTPLSIHYDPDLPHFSWIFQQRSENLLNLLMYGKVDFLWGRDLDISKTDNRLNTITLPENAVMADDYIAWWNPSQMSFAFDMNMGTKEKTFVVANPITGRLDDYCVNRSKYGEQLGIPGDVFSSYDERFLAWEEKKQDSRAELGTVILDLKTGFLAFLDGYGIVGFGESPQ